MSKHIQNAIEYTKRKLSTNKFGSAVLTLVTGTALGQAISLLTVPIVSRLYDQVAYGEYAIIISCATIIGTVSQAGLASAIMAPKHNAEARQVFSTSFIVAFIATVLIIAALALTSGVFQVFSLSVPYWMGILLLFIYSLLNSSVNLIRIYMNRLGMYRALFWNSLIGALSTLLITIPLGFVCAGIIGFMVADIAGKTLCVIQMLSRSIPFTKINLEDCWVLLKKYKRYIIFQFPANFIHTCTQQMPNQVLESAFGNARLGSYSMTNKILAIPSRLIAAPINTAYFKEATDYYHNGKDLGVFSFSLIKKILLCAAPLVLICMAFGEPIFAFVLGEQWRESGIIASILILWYTFDFCFSSTAYCRVAINKQRANFLISILCFIINALGFALGIYFFDDMLSTLVCFGIAGSISKIIDIILNFVCMKSHVKECVLFIGIYVAGLILAAYVLCGIF